MKFSTRTEYGLRALIKLDKKAEKSVSLSQIAKEEGISLAYLERLFAKLKKANIIRAERGVTGGYILTKQAKDFNLFQIVETLEGSLAPFGCVEKEAKGCTICHCKIHPVWQKVYKQIEKTLNSISLDQLM